MNIWSLLYMLYVSFTINRCFCEHLDFILSTKCRVYLNKILFHPLNGICVGSYKTNKTDRKVLTLVNNHEIGVSVFVNFTNSSQQEANTCVLKVYRRRISVNCVPNCSKMRKYPEPSFKVDNNGIHVHFDTHLISDDADQFALYCCV